MRKILGKLRDFIKEHKKLTIIILSAVALLVAATIVTVILLGNRNPDDTSKTEWPEAGVYYYDSGKDEYTLTLNEGGTFALIIKGQSRSGVYTLGSDGAMVLDFAEEGIADATATYAETVITLTVDNSTMRFYKKVDYTVSYETNGGSSIESDAVMNGKTAEKPEDPTREGYIFVGWYLDAGFTTPIAFDSYPITADTVVYAQWVVKTSIDFEYKVKLDPNYDNLPIIDTLTTKGAQLFDLPTLTREGYEFAGWWISTPSDGDKLSYQYVSGMVLDANTTLYALWIETVDSTKLSQPVVNIESGSVRWNSISGARGYNVKIINSDGVAVKDEDTNATTINFSFADYPAGEYRIIVTALSTRGDANNTEAVRYFSNKALAKVSVFEVFNSTLVYNTVENAERYYVSVVCGNPGHNHTNVDNGTSGVFSFANCTMPADGIRFTVTAVAEGFASSTSDTFVYKKVLDAVGGLVYDASTGRVSWNPVQGAAYYMVSVSCGNAAHNHGYINNSTATYVDIRECVATDGKITVSVYPVTKGCASPAASTLEVAKDHLPTPSDIRINDTLISWADVEGATSYEVMVGGKTYTTDKPSYNLSDIINYVEGTEYKISIRAVGTTASLWSDAISTRYFKLSDKLEYNRSTLTWSAVIGATGYELQINDGEIISLSDGAHSSKVTLTKEGINVIKLRFVAGNHASDWISTEVFAYAIHLDPRGGSNVSVQYKAIGDELDLPTPEKVGYTFDYWYNAPGGPSGNALAYTDTLFAENGAISLYAYYNPVKLTVEYNYGVGGSAPETTGTVAYESDYQLVVPTPSSVTSAFAGWFEAPYGMGTQYTDEYGKSLAEWDELEGKILYAFWVDPTLSFSKITSNSKEGYSVSAGSAIALVEEVTVPATYKGLPVLMIAGNGFQDCTNLKVLNLPSSLESISLIDPFKGCASLETVNVYEVEGAVRYSSYDGVLFYNGANGSSLAGAKVAFVPLGKTGTYRLPDGLTEVTAESFKGSAISKIIIPTSVTKIGEGAFSKCKNLTSVVFEVSSGTQKNLTIDARAFAGCTKLDSITLPSRLTEINLTRYSVNGTDVDTVAVNDAFYGCTSLSEINISSSNSTYKSVDGIIYSDKGKTLLYCPLTKIGSVTVPDGVQAIAPGAFVGCSLVDEIVISKSVSYIGECAFYNTKISSVTFKKNDNYNTGVTIGEYAFRGCTSLSTLNLEDGNLIKTISEGAFMGCTSISEITLPASLKTIGKDAFRNCTGIQSIVFAKNGVELTFEENAFYGCTGLRSIELPDYVSEIPSVFAGCVNISEIIVSDDNPYFNSIDGVLYNEAGTELIFFPRGKTGTYTVPEGVKIIGDGVFNSVTGLTRLELPSSLESIGDEAFRYFKIYSTVDGAGIFFYGTNTETTLTIGDYAFANCYVPTLALPSHTKSIGDYCFYSADVYKTAFNLVDNKKLESIGAYAFVDFMTYCVTDSESDAQRYIITIPGSVKVIGAYAFYDNPFVHVVFNEGLQVIGECAFMETRSINNIKIPTTVTTIGDKAFYQSSGLETLNITTETGFGSDKKISQLKTIGAYAFAETAIQSVTIPKSVTEIGACAFSDCYSLKTVKFEAGGTEDIALGTPYLGRELDPDAAQWFTVILRGRVFQNCISLANVTLPARLTEIYPYTFYTCCSPNEGECTSALTVTFEQGSKLAVIGEYAFYNCHLQEIEIPASIRNLDPVTNGPFGISYDRIAIGAYAFGRDTSCSFGELTSVTFAPGGTGNLTIGEYAFYGAKFEEITLPARLAPYTSYNGNVIEGLANGVHVFERASNFSAIHIENGGKYYAVKDGILYNADYTELLFAPISLSGKVTIPATVRKIHESAFLGCTKVTEIVLEAGSADTVIGVNAFNGCTGLLVLTLPNNVTHLGANALKGCSSLTTLTLSKNLENFEYSMIIGCDSLKEVITPDGMAIIYSDNGVLYTGDKETLIYYPPNREGTTYTVLPGTKFIAEDAFRNNSYLETVILPDGLVEIKANAFYGAKSLVSIRIPTSVEVIGKGAFQSSALTTLTFEAGGNAALVIDNSAFAGTRISSVVLPVRLVVLGNYAFSGVSTLQEVTFAEGCRLTTIGSYTFQQTAIREFVLPDNIVSMGSYNFYSCSSLVSFSFNSSIKTIGDGNLEGTGITEIYIPASLSSMGVNTFANCTRLATVTFSPDTSLISIPAGTFARTAITDIRIPAVIKALGDKIILEEDEEADESAPTSYGVFEGCTSLTSISFESGTNCSILGAAAFSGCSSLRYFEIPGSVVELGESLFANCTGLTSMTVPHTVTKLGKSVFSGCRNLSEVELRTRTTELPANLFSGCSSITNITIPTNVSNIGEGCFSGTSIAKFDIADDNNFIKEMSDILYNQDYSVMLAIPPKAVFTSITFPSGLLEIGPSAFAGINTLVEINFEEGGINPLTIASGAFNSCRNLSLVELPARLETIGANAFFDCISLVSINLPENLVSIGEKAFYGCLKLIEVYNESSLVITPGVTSGQNSNGQIADYVKKVLKPGDASILNIDENGYITAYFDPYANSASAMGDITLLVGYVGNEVNLVIPEGVDGIYKYALQYAGQFETILFPSGLGMAINPEQAFMNCGSPMIFFEDASIPKNWHDWTEDESKVIFGYDGNEHTYTFNTDYVGPIDSITTKYDITLPVLDNVGEFIFVGWYNNPEFTGTPISGSYYSKDDTTFYAKWMSEDELYAGADIEHAFELEFDIPVEIVIDEGGERVYYKFTVTEVGEYYIYTYDVNGDLDDTWGYLYNENGELIQSEDRGFDDHWAHFGMTAQLEAGTYYISTAYNFDHVLGDYMLVLSTVKPQ